MFLQCLDSIVYIPLMFEFYRIHDNYDGCIVIDKLHITEVFTHAYTPVSICTTTSACVITLSSV